MKKGLFKKILVAMMCIGKCYRIDTGTVVYCAYEK